MAMSLSAVGLVHVLGSRTLMSQRSLETITGLVVADEDLRLRLASDPIATVVAWLNAGFALTPGEIDAIIQLDATEWPRID
jgi:hypothetical protein